MESQSTRRWPLFVGLAAIIILAGGSMWLGNRARKTNAVHAAAPDEAPASATALPALDQVAPTQVETATFSMG